MIESVSATQNPLHNLSAEYQPSTAAVISVASKTVQDSLIERLEFFRPRRVSVVDKDAKQLMKHKSLLVAVAEEALPEHTTVTATPQDAPQKVKVDHADEYKHNLDRLNREQIAVNTLRLFSTLLSFHPGDKYVVENLVLDAPNTVASKSIAENSVWIKDFLSRIDAIHLKIAEALAAVPETSDVSSPEITNQLYISHVQKKLTKNKVYFTQWYTKESEAPSTAATEGDEKLTERPFMRAWAKLCLSLI